MSPARLTFAIWICALLCLQETPSWAAEPKHLPIQVDEVTAPVRRTDIEVPQSAALPYGSGYEQRLRVASRPNPEAIPSASGTSMGTSALHEAAFAEANGGSGRSSGARGNGGGGRSR